MKIRILTLVSLVLFSFLIGQNLELRHQQLQSVRNHLEQIRIQQKKTEKRQQRLSKLKHQVHSQRVQYDRRLSDLLESDQSLETLFETIQMERSRLVMEVSCLSQAYRCLLQELILSETSFSDHGSEPPGLTTLILSYARIMADTENSLQEVSEQAGMCKDELAELKQTIARTRDRTRNADQRLADLDREFADLTQKKMEYEQQLQQLEDNIQSLEQLIGTLSLYSNEDGEKPHFATERIPWPVQGSVIRKFGIYRHPEHKKLVFDNKGIDIGLEKAGDVSAVEDGVVIFAQWYRNQGKVVIVDHKNGFHSLYAQADQLLVSKGEQVRRNQVIAKVGLENESYLHFELRCKGRPVDPLLYLE